MVLTVSRRRRSAGPEQPDVLGARGTCISALTQVCRTRVVALGSFTKIRIFLDLAKELNLLTDPPSHLLSGRTLEDGALVRACGVVRRCGQGWVHRRWPWRLQCSRWSKVGPVVDESQHIHVR